MADDTASIKLKLSCQVIIDLVNNLAALDGKTRVIKDGEREQVVREPYKFKPGLRSAIAKNVANLKAVADAYSKTKDGLIGQVTGGMTQIAEKHGETVNPDFQKQMADFQAVNNLLLAEIHEVRLVKIKESELNLEANPIPGTVIAALAPILDEAGYAPDEPVVVALPAMPAVQPAANGADATQH